MFDPEKAKQLECNACDKNLQALRNCSGTGIPARIVLNDSLYTRCPRATYLESYDARYFVRLYHSCKEMGTYPSPGGILDQTTFTIELFDFIDDLYSKQRNKPKPVQT